MLKAKRDEINEQRKEKYELPAQNCPLVLGGVTTRDKKDPLLSRVETPPGTKG
jgi:hypothetical protein